MLSQEDIKKLHDLVSSQNSLMRLLSARVSDDALTYIAGLDGDYNREANLRALRRVQTGEVMPVEQPKTWIPREVIEIFQWSEFGERHATNFPGDAIVFHTARAFGCAAWLEAYATMWDKDVLNGPNTPIILLLYSLEEIGPEFEQASPPFFAWLASKLMAEDDERAFFVLALLWSMVRAQRTESDPEFTSNLIDWLFEEEASVRTWWGGVCNVSHRWLLGTTYHKSRHSYWSGLSDGFVAAANETADLNLAARLRDIGERLAD